MRITWCLILVAAGMGYASDDAEEWPRRFSEGQVLWRSGHYLDAEKAFRESLAGAERANADGQLIVLHDALGGTCTDAGQFAQAAAEYKRAMAMVGESEGRTSIHYAVLAASLSNLPTQTVVSEDMVSLLRSAIGRNGSAHDLAVLRGSLARILKKQKRYEEVETLLLDGLSDLAKQKVPDAEAKGGFLNDLSALRLEQGRYREAADLEKESIRVWAGDVGQEHPTLVVPYNNLALAYMKLGWYEEADRIFQTAIDLCRKTLSEDHLYYAYVLENRAGLLQIMGRRREAKKVIEQAVRIERAANRRNGVGSTVSVKALLSK